MIALNLGTFVTCLLIAVLIGFVLGRKSTSNKL